jgi:hypothetical protein
LRFTSRGGTRGFVRVMVAGYTPEPYSTARQIARHFVSFINCLRAGLGRKYRKQLPHLIHSKKISLADVNSRLILLVWKLALDRWGFAFRFKNAAIPARGSSQVFYDPHSRGEWPSLSPAAAFGGVRAILLCKFVQPAVCIRRQVLSSSHYSSIDL